MVTEAQRPASLGTGLTNPEDPRHPRFLANLRLVLSSSASAMRDTETERAKKRRELAELQRELADVATDCQMDVAVETNGDGKAVYTNAESRAAAVRKRLRENGHARSLQQRIDQTDVRLSELEIEFDAARRTRQNALAQMEFAGRWLGYWSNHTTEEEPSR